MLTSTRNPRVRAAAALARRRERTARGQHLAEGPRAVAEALAAGLVEELFVTPDRAGEFDLPPTVTLTTVADHVLATIADATSPQGVVAVVRTPGADFGDVPAAGQVVLVLDRLGDPGNVGTIVRTADAAGAAGVVVTTGSADPFGPKAARAAVGSTYHLPIVTGVTLADVAERYRVEGRRLLGLDASGARSVFDLDAGEGPVALVLGSEAHGLDPAVPLDGTLAVPIAGRAESLNVAAAAAVAVYAATRTLRDRPSR